MREIKLLKYGWKFKKGDYPESIKISFNASDWEEVRVPHDWAIKGPFSPDNDLRTTKEGKVEGTGATGGLPHTGKGWYRLKFNLPEDVKKKRVRIEFDGVMSHSKVYVNEKLAGEWHYGYSSFAFDITEYVQPRENILTVSVDNKPNSSRWYPGAGIYRNVRLVILNPVHISLWGTYITTHLIDKKEARIDIRTEIENNTDKELSVETESVIISPDGKKVVSDTVKKSLKEKEMVYQEVFIKSPVLWDIKSPALYTLCSTVKINGEKVDYYETRFGIRETIFDPEKGFFLNGNPLKFQGVCMHHDLGPIGTAINKSALKRQLSILKEMGCNAIRTSHNPPAPELLELTDEMGFLVIDEAFDEWKIPKCANGYNTIFDEWAEKDLRAMIRRDRNHPSVIMWSIGNEIPEQEDPDNGPKLARFLHNICKEEDPSRPTTSAFNIPDSAIKNGLAGIVDIPGWNYQPHKYGKYHQLLPGKPMYGSETASCISSRGEYFFPVEEERYINNYYKRANLQVNSYDLSCPGWATIPDVEFRAQDDHPFIMGEFVWTGFDYLGEPTPYYKEWPSRSSYFGIVDLCGIPKDRFYLYQSRWAPEKGTLHILPHWTHPGYEGKITPVHCYTSWDRVELFVNGKSCGVKTKDPRNILNRYRLVWYIVYEPGEIKAVAYDSKGNTVKETTVRTAGAPAEIVLIPDRKEITGDGEDMAFVYVEITDAKGTLCPKADNLIKFKVEGPAEIVAVDNGDPTSTEPFYHPYRKAFNGKCVVYFRSIEGKKGNVKLIAQSEGLVECVASITVK
ncbi:MAG TPA: beta-galactosidase GalB [bacterium]|nr:beta-galactosidase GalB [bacterium]HPP29886.1 beta-galactosidase GalB [bacterium]